MTAAPAAPAAPERGNVLGVAVSSLTLEDAVARIADFVDRRRRAYVCVTGVHGVMECRRDPGLRDIHNRAALVTPDGMPLVWFRRLCGDRRIGRVYGPDLMRAVTAASVARGYRHFYYGGAEGVADHLAATLTAAHPGLRVVGTLCPPFRKLAPEEDRAEIAAINAAHPDIVWVGLSTPKQEIWMAEHRAALDAPVLIGVGAAFDFLAGTKRQAPAWLGRHGLEWLFRLCSEPRRLWRRYAYIVPGFLCLAAADFLRRALRRPSTLELRSRRR